MGDAPEVSLKLASSGRSLLALSIILSTSVVGEIDHISEKHSPCGGVAHASGSSGERQSATKSFLSNSRVDQSNFVLLHCVQSECGELEQRVSDRQGYHFHIAAPTK